MSMQSLIMSNIKLTNLFMSRMPARFWEKQGTKKALSSFHIAAARVPAYRDFLKQHKVNPKMIKTIGDFKKLPVIDKKNYIQEYDIKELCLDGTLQGKYTIERSSGHSGGSFFWPRISDEDKMFPKYIEYAFRQFYEIDKKHTLVVITLAQGTWTSGEKMAQALREIAARDAYSLSVITPGTDIDEAIEIVESLSNRYEQTVIVGYPPFIKCIIDMGVERGINWKKLNVKLGLGGERYSEEWREYMANILGIKDRELLGISGGYGAADIGMSIAREYPITVLVRKLAFEDSDLAEDLFGEDSVLPSLMQYNPASVFIEEVNQEVVFTTRSGFYPVRYNIHDRGGVISFEQILKILETRNYNVIDLLESYGYSRQQIWQLPFFYVFGRSDGTVSISGPNVYPENIEPALYEKKAKRINGFRLAKIVDENQNERLYILVEHKRGVKISSETEKTKLEKEYHDLFLRKLLEVNKDFGHMYRHNSKIDPVIKIYAFGKGPFAYGGKIKCHYIHRQAVNL